jgi:opacity protein-like surface antigen
MHRFLVLIALIVSSALNAQMAAPQFSLPLSVAIPINEFDETHTGNDAFFGLGGEFNLPVLNDSPLRVGVSFRYFWMGNKARDVEVSDSLGTYDVDTRVRGSMMPLHFFARFDPMSMYDYPVMPYAGGFIGPRFFSVTTVVEIDYRDGFEPEEEKDRRVSTTFSYGFQLGLHIRIHESMLLDLRWERAYGSEAEYLDVRSVEIDDEGYAFYQVLETRTDMDIFTVGLVLELN